MKKRKVRVLSIDGGGIRGLIVAVVLAKFENLIRRKTSLDVRLADFFDFVSGTSTGGIIATGLLIPDENGRPLYSAQDIVNFYLKDGKDIFSNDLFGNIKSFWGIFDSKFSERGIEGALEKYFSNAKLSDLLKPCLVTSYEIFLRKNFFFASHRAKKERARDFYLKDLVRATSAAPTYFRAAKISSLEDESFFLIDGGLFANNPSLCAYSEIRNRFIGHPTAKDMFILSLGTGKVKRPYLYDKARKWGKLGWIVPVIDILMSSGSEAVDFHLRKIFESVDCSDDYVRIEPDISDVSSQLDNVDAQNLKNLVLLGEKEFERNFDFFDRLSDELILDF